MRYLYIAGKWTEAADGGTAQTINPYDATVLDTLAEAGAADADAAVAAAREAFDQGPWRRSTVTDRAALLGKIADLLQRDREQLAHTESLDTGSWTMRDRKSTRLNSSHQCLSRMPSSA